MSIPRNLSFLAQGASATGVLSATYGGTGLATLTANNILLGNGTGTVNFVAPGTSGNVLTSNGTTWASTAPSATTSIANGTSNVSISSSAGSITMQTAGTSAVTVDTSQNLLFNSGYGSVAAAYGCRAWVTFTGVTTVSILASANVSSITRNTAGDYSINFTTAMPDANYSAGALCVGTGNANGRGGVEICNTANPTSSVFRIVTCAMQNISIPRDTPWCQVAVFR